MTKELGNSMSPKKERGKSTWPLKSEYIIWSYSCQNPRNKFRIWAKKCECVDVWKTLWNSNLSSHFQNMGLQLWLSGSFPNQLPLCRRGQAWRLFICEESNYHATCILVLHVELGISIFLRILYCWHSMD